MLKTLPNIQQTLSIRSQIRHKHFVFIINVIN